MSPPPGIGADGRRAIDGGSWRGSYPPTGALQRAVPALAGRKVFWWRKGEDVARQEFMPGVPLGDLVGKANVLLTCRKCIWRETYDLRAVIANLLARDVNGPLIGICAAAAHVRTACPRCGAWSWETTPDYGPYRGPGG